MIAERKCFAVILALVGCLSDAFRLRQFKVLVMRKFFGVSFNKGFLPDCMVFLPALLAVLFFSYQARAYQLDDALIYLRYIQNFQDGFGLVYNPGESFNGLTSPLFTYIMVLTSLLFSDLQVLTISLSAFFLFFAACFSAGAFAETTLGKGLIALSVTSFGYFYTTFGMETPLFLFLVALSLYLYKQCSDGFVIVLALLVITRSEGVFLAAPMAIHFIVTKRRLPEAKYFIPALLIFFFPYIFNFLYYGHPLPVTGSAKIGQGQSGLWGEGLIFFNVRYLVDWVFSGSIFVTAVFWCLSAVGFVLLKNAPIKFISLVFVVFLLLFYGGLNIPNYHWYYAPFFLFAVCFVGRFFEYAFELAFKRKYGFGFSGLAFCSASLGLVLLAFYVVETEERGRFEPYANIGSWINKNTDPESTVAMVEIGTVGWYSDRHIVDILGLTNKYNADYVAKRDLISWVFHYKSDYILIHDPAWPHEKAAVLLQSQGFYREVKDFGFPGYVLLKKNNSVDPEEINSFIESVHEGSAFLKELRSSSSLGDPYIIYRSSRLFAHAPVTLFAEILGEFDSLHFRFGIEDGAFGKHAAVCFRISDVRMQEELFVRCIDDTAEVGDLHQKAVLDISNSGNRDLMFEISCDQSCDYAWTYWEDFRLK